MKVKSVINYVIPLLQTIVMPSLYYFDIIADVIFAYDLAANCHWKYLSTSLSILVLSYACTVLFLKFRLALSWKRSVFYPHYHSKLFFQRLWIAIRGMHKVILRLFYLLSHIACKIRYYLFTS